ncbi:MAG: ferredoxin, partial [Candidatus Pacebacteria bacterium]|nr:ferredoxin [Candidatus Paceibacterota bacterium]
NKTGVSFGTIDEIRVDYKVVQEAAPKSIISIKVPEKVRKNDMFYIVVHKENPQDYANVKTVTDNEDREDYVDVKKKVDKEDVQNFTNIQTDKKKFIISLQRKNCIGCGSCAVYSPSCWKINKQTGRADLINGVEKGNVVVAEVNREFLEENKRAADSCPMQVIKLNKD